jgi:hypothetical protein
VSDLGSVLRLEARRRAAIITVPILAAVGLPAAWSGLIPGIAYWDTSATAVSGSVRYMGPVAAGIAAWVGIRERRGGYLRRLSPRSPAVGPSLDLLVLTALALLSYCLVSAAVLGYTLFQGATGRADPLTLLSGAGALVLNVMVGYTLGSAAAPFRSIPMPPVAVLTAVAVWGWMEMRSYAGSWLNLTPPGPARPVGPFSALKPWLAATQALWALGLAGGMLLAYLWLLTRRTLLLLPLAAALVLTTICTVRLHSYRGKAMTPAVPADYACRRWPLPICVHPALASALPALEAAVTPLAIRVDGTPEAFHKVRQSPSTVPVGVRAGVARIHLPDLSAGFDHRAAVDLASALAACHLTSSTTGAKPPGTTAQAAYGAMVTSWLADDQTPPLPYAGPLAYTFQAAANRWAGWQEDQRRQWLRIHFNHFRTCTLTAQDFTSTRTTPTPRTIGNAPRPRATEKRRSQPPA